MDGLDARHVPRRRRAAVGDAVAEHADARHRHRLSRARCSSRERTSRKDAARPGRSSWSARRGSTAERFADALNARRLPGVHFRPAVFEPTFHKHAKTTCGGCQIHVTDRASVRAGRWPASLLTEAFRAADPDALRVAAAALRIRTRRSCRSTSSAASSETARADRGRREGARRSPDRWQPSVAEFERRSREVPAVLNVASGVDMASGLWTRLLAGLKTGHYVDARLPRGIARDEDLLGVLVGVGRVDARATCAPCSARCSVCVPSRSHSASDMPIEDLGGRSARGLERVERRFDRTVGVVQLVARTRPGRSRRWPGARRRDEQAQPDRRRHLAVGQVVDDLARRPFARRRARIQLLVGRARQRLGRPRGTRPCRHRPASVSSALSIVCHWPGVLQVRGCHRSTCDQPRVLAIPGAAASCSVGGSDDAPPGDRAGARTPRPACRRTGSRSRSRS